MPQTSQFTGEQIAFAPRPAEAGLPVEDFCRTLGVSQATPCRWKQKYGARVTAALWRLCQPGEEDKRLK